MADKIGERMALRFVETAVMPFATHAPAKGNTHYVISETGKIQQFGRRGKRVRVASGLGRPRRGTKLVGGLEFSEEGR